MELEILKHKLNKCYSRDICYPKIANDWNENNKSFGMCAITVLIVNDIFGAHICKIYVDDISHYFNRINGEIVDLTSSQFSFNIKYENYTIASKESILNNDSIKRYKVLKQRLEREK